MRWSVVGAGGMLGQDVVARLRELDAEHEVRALTRADLDVTAAEACLEVLAGSDVVVNCAAHTAVDAAETEEGAAFAINAQGAWNVARAAAATGARLVHVSTDYVFDGSASEPYAADAPQAPRSAYGRTKAAGEWAVRASGADALTVRTAWLYGEHGGCFPRTIARAGAQRGALSVVDDQHGQPTWTVDVARIVTDLVLTRAPAGEYHATAAGSASWFDFAAAVLAAADLGRVELTATTSADFVRPAPRPAYSVLDHASLRQAGVEPIGDWRERWALAAPAVLAG